MFLLIGLFFNFRNLNMFKFNLLVVVNFVFDNVVILLDVLLNREFISPRMTWALWSNPFVFRTAWSVGKLRPSSTFWLCESRLHAIKIIILKGKIRTRRETTCKHKFLIISSEDSVLGTSWGIMRSSWAFWRNEWSCRLLGIEVVKQSLKESIEIWVFLNCFNAFT